ncbi:hypothetical protein M91_16269, partial [Bos mutus]
MSPTCLRIKLSTQCCARYSQILRLCCENKSCGSLSCAKMACVCECVHLRVCMSVCVCET